MRHKFLYRGTSAVVGLVTALFGFTGLASAQATIVNTGPGSHNKIVSSQKTECETTNTNKVNVNNYNNQKATTGNVKVSHNTNVGGWGAWDPAVWAANGHSYQEWQSAFANYMQTVQTNWGSASPSGVSSGDASNHNSTNIALNINNQTDDQNCGPNGGGKGGGTIDTTGPNSTNVIKNSDYSSDELTNYNALSAKNSSNQKATSGNVGQYGNTQGGGGSSGRANNANNSSASFGLGGGSGSGGSGGGGGSTPGTMASSISNTGPSSYNKISSSNSHTSTTSNNNIIHTSNTNHQTANSGSSSSFHNTSAGGSSGGAANSNTGSVNIQN